MISYSVAEHGERELAVGLAVTVMAPPAQVADYLASGELLARDATILEHGLMSDPTVLPAVRFAAGERDEAESLLEASPGTRFNLSADEIRGFRSLRATLGGSGGSRADLISDEYRKLLRDRWQAYQRGGLAAIAAYARSEGATTDPAAELRRAVADAEPIARYGTVLRDALTRYPSAQPPHVVHRHYWVKRRVQRRPDLSLLHQVVIAGPDLVVHVERYFYVGHSYNAAQIITGAVAVPEGAVVFATSRFSTDEVLGLGNQLKRGIGRTQLRDEMRKRLEGVRRALRPVPPPPQTP